MPLVRFVAPHAEPLVRAVGATVAALARRGWICVLDAEGADPALEPLGAVRSAPRAPDLVVGANGDLRPARGASGPDAVALRVHEGLDAKVAALGALRGAPLGPDEARAVISEALALGAGTGAESFTYESEAARRRLAALLRENGVRTR